MEAEDEEEEEEEAEEDEEVTTPPYVSFPRVFRGVQRPRRKFWLPPVNLVVLKLI